MSRDTVPRARRLTPNAVVQKVRMGVSGLRHLARLLTQELALMNERDDPRRAFQQQSVLLSESFSQAE